jgi:hypothetical protein
MCLNCGLGSGIVDGRLLYLFRRFVLFARFLRAPEA